MNKENFDRLVEAIGPVRMTWLTEHEIHTLEWLSGWETSTIDSLCIILRNQTFAPDDPRAHIF